MKITFEPKPSAQTPTIRGETLVRFLTKAERADIPLELPESEWSAEKNSVLHLHHENLICVGLGDAEKADSHTLRSASGVAVNFLKKIGRARTAFDLEKWPQFTDAVCEGAVLADYRFEKFKDKKTEPLKSLRCIVSKNDLADAKKRGERGEILANATNLAREIGNEPGNVIFPESLGDAAIEMAAREGLEIEVFDEKQLRSGKFGGILAVGSGSKNPPRMIVLRHRGGGSASAAKQNPIALVGKAITFDTGGISIKPASNMEEMIFDKAGGMAVLGAMAGIARLKLKRHVVAVIASAENMPGAAAYRPGDIVTAYDGKHIEIVNTDAEGRVVLADAISYARKNLRAAAIIDLATLTGACGVALGDSAAGLWSTSEELKNAVLAASEKTGERLWPMPLYDDYFDQIKSEVALIKNSGGRLGGACTAAAFLKTFAEDVPWAHLDIAHMANLTKPRPDLAHGATGFGVRLLIELMESWRKQ